MTGCAFCSIASGVSDALVVHRTDSLVAFLDHRPVFPGHVLVIPVAHHETIEDLPGALIDPLFRLVQTMAHGVRTAVDAPGSFVAVNNVISQSVPHLHVHVVPRRHKDGLRGFFWPRTGYEDDHHAVDVQRRIVEALARNRKTNP